MLNNFDFSSLIKCRSKVKLLSDSKTKIIFFKIVFILLIYQIYRQNVVGY